MGGGKWTSASYAAGTSSRLASGTAFAYSGDTKSKARTQWTVHEDLDPKSVNNAGAHADKNIREALDSIEHPTTLAIAVLFDVTGSMAMYPEELAKKLPDLLGLLQQRGYVEHPQIMFGAIGDATCDRVPLQMAQFESDNRMDAHLEKIFLENGGGGQNTESYELALYFLARHTYIDCWEQRQQKGFAFIIGDESPYPAVNGAEVRAHIDEGINPQESITFEDILTEASKTWDINYVQPSGAYNASDTGTIKRWKDALGEDHFLTFDKADEICETIGIAIATQTAVADLSKLTGAPSTP